jgi:hypothetical protein
MLRYATLRGNAKQFLALTGVTRREFDTLLPAFEWARAQQVPTRRRRQRAPGAGRPALLPTAADQLLFLLVYLKTGPLQTLHAELFGMSQPSANRYIHQLLPVVAAALDHIGVMPERNGRQLVRRGRPHADARLVDVILDGVERRRQRPANPDQQQRHYSGKKKAHMDKNLVVVDTRTKQVRYLSPTQPGSMHDKRMADDAKLRYPKGSILRSDLGFQGYAPDVAQHLQPKKSHVRKTSRRGKNGTTVR